MSRFVNTACSASAFVANVLGFYITAVLLNSFSEIASFTDVDVVKISTRNLVYKVRKLLFFKLVFHRPHSTSELARRHMSEINFMRPKDLGQTFAYVRDV